MEIKWHNLIALAFLLTALILFLTQLETISGTLGSLGQIGPGHPPEQQATGLVCLGLILITILAALRIACSSSDGNR